MTCWRLLPWLGSGRVLPWGASTLGTGEGTSGADWTTLPLSGVDWVMNGSGDW